jgi:hypothetical protein
MPYSHNGDFERLVEQITDVIVARLNGDGAEPDGACGCGSTCFNRCPERMQRVLDAGASRIGVILGDAATARDWASLVDHTLLKPERVREPFVGEDLGLRAARVGRAGLHGGRVSFGRDARRREGV